MYRKFGGALLLCLLALSGASQSAFAAAGDLDPSFGAGGLATSPAPTDYQFGTFDAVEQSDGKVVVASNRYLFSTGAGITLQRVNKDGSPDDSFGVGGYATVTAPSALWIPYDIAVSSTGKIAVSGYRFSSPDYQVLVILFNADGTLDPSFDGDGSNICAGNGVVCTQIDAVGKQDTGRAVTFQPDGKIVAAGSSKLSSGYYVMSAVRYTVTGALDSSFDSDGKVQAQVGPWSSSANSVSVLPGGDLVLAGLAEGKGPNWNGVEVYTDAIGIVKLAGNGAVDPTFHSVPGNYTGTPYTQGVLFSPRVEWTYGSAYDAAVDSAGRIVVTGYANNVSPSPTATSTIVARVTPSGALDSTFGAGGRSLVDVGQDSAGYTVRTDSSDRPLVVGYSNANSSQDTMVVRLTTGGALDGSFQGVGYKVYSSSSVGIDPGTVLTSDGKLLLAGAETDKRWRILRLLLADDPVPPPRPTAVIPAVKIGAPNKKRLKASKLKSVSGTAGPIGSVKKVEIALQLKDSRLLKKKKRCAWLSSAKAKFKLVKAKKGKCASLYYRTASGTTRWKYRLKKTLPVGSYALSARVTLSDGSSATSVYSFKLTK